MTIQRIDTVDIHNLATDSVASGDFLGFSDEDEAGDVSNKVTVDDFVSAIAGSGLSASGIQLEATGGGVSLSGSTANRVTTVTGANAIEGEDNLQFNGNSLSITTGSASQVPLTVSGASGQLVNLVTIEDSSASEFLTVLSTGTIQLGFTGTHRIQTEVATGTDTAGKNLDLRGGKSTGTGVGGPVVFYTSPSGSTGSAVNAHQEAVRIEGDGSVRLFNDGTHRIYVEEESGTDTAGKNLDLRAGKSTGSGEGGAVVFYASPSGSTGSAVNSHEEALRIDSDGAIRFSLESNHRIFVEEVSGTNVAGKNLDLRAGKPTGSGNGGSIRMYVAPAGSSGTSPRGYSEALRIWSDLIVDFKAATDDGTGVDTMAAQAYLPIKAGGTDYFLPLYGAGP